MVKLLFLARVYGIELEAGAILAYAVSLVAVSFTAPGAPSGGMIASAPPLLAAGIPMEGIARLSRWTHCRTSPRRWRT